MISNVLKNNIDKFKNTETENNTKNELIQKLRMLNEKQDNKIQEFAQELEVINDLKTDLTTYNQQLQELSQELKGKSIECEKLNRTNIDLRVNLESQKNRIDDLENAKLKEMNWKNLYNELKSKVDNINKSNSRDEGNITSPLRQEIDNQSELIKIKGDNLKLFSEINDFKERMIQYEKLLKKKDDQISSLKELLEEGDSLKQILQENKK